MRPQQADQPLRQLRQVVVQLLTQAPHQEREALEQALHVGVFCAGFIQIQLRRTIRKGLGKLFARFPQVAHFSVEVTQGWVVSSQNRILIKVN
ncbi:hypothetical protein D3C81_1725390 [compost metagenome]